MATKESIEAFAKANGIEVKSTFVPWSQSRSFKAGAKTTDRNLNWKVTVSRNGRDFLTCDYSAGIAHAPSYKQRLGRNGLTMDDAKALEYETERGFPAFVAHGFQGRKPDSKPILPSPADVLYSLVSDSDVLNHSTFESWSEDLGYDADSRKGEAIYRECLSQALKLRNGLGEALLAQLTEVVQDY